MSQPVIRVERLAKRYKIGRPARYHALRDRLAHALAAPARLARGLPRGEREAQEAGHIWALRDVSFEVRQGEVVGIIGRNGAGKSTLLKLLSRITRPTSGRIGVRGRVGSLLEVGTGFHPELSGRENIYLNGAILGMPRAEIGRKFDAIVAFAEVEQFIDTPVKHYSSGMYMRLAFAVAAHLEPEVLVVDEVLAVGDAAFQRKCLGKMGEVAGAGRTVLFVSHQLSQVRRLCGRALWMDHGQLRQSGPVAELVGAYEAALAAPPQAEGRADEGAPARFVGWRIVRPDADGPHTLASRGPLTVGFTLDVRRALTHTWHGVALYNADNVLLWCTTVQNLALAAGRRELTYELPGGLPLRPGPYSWLVTLFDGDRLIDSLHCTPAMSVSTEPLAVAPDSWQGLLNIGWEFEVR